MNIGNNIYQQAVIYNQYGRAQNYDRRNQDFSSDSASKDREVSNVKDRATISKDALDSSIAAKDKGASDKEKEQKIQQEVQKLRAIEEKVKAHEQAHKSAGGQFAGAVNYSYTTGPDGKRYITGGEVQIQIVQGKTPEETIRNMEVVRRAALAPADPSPQDRAVAAQATQIQQRARADQAKLKAEQDKGKDRGDPAEGAKDNTSTGSALSKGGTKDISSVAGSDDKGIQSMPQQGLFRKGINQSAHSTYRKVSSIVNESGFSLFA